MRIFGVVLILIGLLVCLTIVGIPFGIFLMFIGTLCAIFGGRRRTTITNIVQVSTMPGAQVAQVPQDDGYQDTMRTIEPPRQEPRLVNPSRSAPTGLLDRNVIDASPNEYPSSAQTYDKNKWNALVEFDDDIRRVVDALRPYGQKYVDQFAAAFLALNDKDYLPMIVKKILEAARQDGLAARSRQ